MTIIALDLGATMGYAIGSPDSYVLSGSDCFKPSRYEGGGIRFLRFKQWLDEIWNSFGGDITKVAFEEVRRHAGTDAAHVYGGFLAVLTAWCEDHDVPYEGVPVGTIKKFATGKGNAKKDAMIEAARSWGYEPVDDNEADAIAILHYATVN